MATVFKRSGKGKWLASWVDHNGKRVTKSTLTTDKATAKRIANKHEADAALRRDGVIDPTLDAIGRESQRSIESHLADFESKLRAASRTEKHITSTIKFIRRIADFAGFNLATDISADGVNRYAGKLRDDGRSARTIQSHLNAIKAFTKWLAEHHKLPRNPLASVKTPNPKADRRRERRMILPEEWRRLEIALSNTQERHGMPGHERLLLYHTAIQTGLRSNEIRSLTRGQLYFDAKPPYITCKAGSTKNRRDAQQYIQPELAADLKAHIATKAPKSLVFNLPHETHLARMLRKDLAIARKQWLQEAIKNPQEYSNREQSDFLVDTNHEGEILDFHSLRHTCGAWLSMTGANPKTVQQIMRHQSITLTMDTYGHMFPGQEADAVDRMRKMFAGSPEPLRATGTDDTAVENSEFARSARRSAQDAKPCVSGATGCDDEAFKPPAKKAPKPLCIADLGEEVQASATDCESSGGGTRTPDTRIMIPLL